MIQGKEMIRTGKMYGEVGQGKQGGITEARQGKEMIRTEENVGGCWTRKTRRNCDKGKR